MNLRRPPSHRAFTIMELLVVIGIIVIVAGLVVGLNNVATEKKKLQRVRVELQQMVMLIEGYRSKLGVLPPDNTNNPALNTLFYELAGAERTVNSPITFITPFGNIQSNLLRSTFGIEGLINSAVIGPDGDRTEIRRILRRVKADQTNQLVPGVISLVVPVEGPNGLPNAWNYLRGDRGTGLPTESIGNHTLRNPESFDLWVDVVVRGKTNRIGNWKD